ncbi:EXS, C-terminal [Phytophthora cactorum]|nr:EXS, C-terminal [Phytophthora cactorum]
MVNFSLRLRDNSVAEWRGDYLDYDGLKRLLERQQQIDAALSAAASAASSTSVDLAKKISSKLPFLRLPETPPTSTDSDQLQSLLSTPVAFEEALEYEYSKVEHAYMRHTAQLAEQLEHLQAQYRENATATAQESLKNSLVELHRLLNLLHNFALLNYTGFVKILKRYDKIASFPGTSASSRKPNYRPMPELLKRLEQSFANWFCDGNTNVAVATLMTKKEDFVNWGHIYLGIKAGSCLILLIWVCWDSLVVPTFHNGRENHLLDLVRTRAVALRLACGTDQLPLHLRVNPRRVQSYPQVFSDATNMTIVYLANVLLYYKVVNGYFPEELLHRGYYPLALFFIWSPLYPVSFFHTFVGDYLTSTVKVTQDVSWSVCFFATKEFLRKDVIPPGGHASGLQLMPTEDGPTLCADNVYYVNVVVPLNLRRVYDTKTWWPHLPNAAKYALTQVVVLFGLFHPLHSDNSEENASQVRMFVIAWLMLFTASSLYTWIWDFKFLGDSQMFSRKWIYYVAIVADLFLRFAWTLTLIPPRGVARWLPLYLQPFTMVLELFRRTFWSFFRLENEHLRNTQGFRRVDFIPLHYDHGVGDVEKKSDEVEQLDFRISHSRSWRCFSPYWDSASLPSLSSAKW